LFFFQGSNSNYDWNPQTQTWNPVMLNKGTGSLETCYKEAHRHRNKVLI
jgi:hypothetical protein